MTFIAAIVMSLIFPTIALVRIWYNESNSEANDFIKLLDCGCTAFYIVSVVVVILACRNIRSRVKILERGLNSIHSCAILWEVVVLAHVRALEDLRKSSGQLKSMHGYTKCIGDQAYLITRYASNIHKWIEETRKKLDEELQSKPADQ